VVVVSGDLRVGGGAARGGRMREDWTAALGRIFSRQDRWARGFGGLCAGLAVNRLCAGHGSKRDPVGPGMAKDAFRGSWGDGSWAGGRRCVFGGSGEGRPEAGVRANLGRGLGWAIML